MDWRFVGGRIAPALTIGIGLAMIACLVLVYRMRRTARTTLFGYVRERAILSARRLLILTLVLLVLLVASGGLWGVAVRRPELLPTAVPTPTFTLIPSPTPRTPTPTFTPTPTPTVTPTPTPTSIPADADLVLRAPFPTQAVTPGPDAALAGLVLAAGEQDDAPVSPTTRFPAQTERVYAFFTFDGMSRGVPWVHIWYAEVDGKLVEAWSSVELWAYDAAEGQTWRYFNCRPGKYELHVYVGRGLQIKVPFSVGVE